MLLGRWVHSGEEDTDDALVFRRQDYPLPPSRGRRQMAFYPGHQLKSAGVGAGDTHRVAEGTWAPAARPATDFEITIEDEDGPRGIELTDDGAPKLTLQKRGVD